MPREDRDPIVGLYVLKDFSGFGYFSGVVLEHLPAQGYRVRVSFESPCLF